jgi:hypothetical protein
MKRDKEQVQYQPGHCCFNCASFARPATAGVVLGSCMRVKGQIHPADFCKEFAFADLDDGGDDGDGRPDRRNQHEQQQDVGTSFLMSER